MLARNPVLDEALEDGYLPVETRVLCHITRFRIRSPLALLRFYVWFRRVRCQARGVNGLLKAVFLVENWRTCYTLSLWRDSNALLQFNSSVFAHIEAANSSFGYLRFEPDGAQLWAAKFRLSAVSRYNFRWDGLELAEFLDRKCERSPASAEEPNVA